MTHTFDQIVEARLAAALVTTESWDWSDVERRAAALRSANHSTDTSADVEIPRRADGGRHRGVLGRRVFVLAGVLTALLVASVATAVARGWIFSDEPTLATVAQVTPSTPTAVEFAAIMRTGQLRHPVERAALVFPPGSAYAGTSIRRADGDDSYTCVRALDGMACGALTAASPTVGGVLAHPGSPLPPLAYGAVAADVTSVTLTCANGSFEATILDHRIYVAVLPMETDSDTCSSSWKR